MTDDEKIAAKTDARQRAVDAMADWTRAHYDGEEVMVLSWLIVGEVMHEHGRQVSWASGNGNDPADDDKAGLMRYQIRGLLSEVEATLPIAETT